MREGNNLLSSGYVAKVMAENDASWNMELNASDMYDDPPADNFILDASDLTHPSLKLARVKVTKQP